METIHKVKHKNVQDMNTTKKSHVVTTATNGSDWSDSRESQATPAHQHNNGNSIGSDQNSDKSWGEVPSETSPDIFCPQTYIHTCQETWGIWRVKEEGDVLYDLWKKVCAKKVWKKIEIKMQYMVNIRQQQLNMMDLQKGYESGVCNL